MPSITCENAVLDLPSIDVDKIIIISIITECRSVMTYGSWQAVMYVIHVEGGIEQVFSTFNCYTSLEIPEVNSSH